MMTTTGTQWNLIGDQVRADSYYGYTDGIHTVQITYQNFVGGFGIQGTLALNPNPEDWFWIKLNPYGNNNQPYMTFPVNQLGPTGNNGGDTGSTGFTFIGNFVYLRAVLSRDYIQPNYTPTQASWESWSYGQIDKVLLSL